MFAFFENSSCSAGEEEGAVFIFNRTWTAEKRGRKSSLQVHPTWPTPTSDSLNESSEDIFPARTDTAKIVFLRLCCNHMHVISVLLKNCSIKLLNLNLHTVQIYTEKQAYPTNTEVMFLAVSEDGSDPEDFLWDFGDSSSTRTTSRTTVKKYRKPGRLETKGHLSFRAQWSRNGVSVPTQVSGGFSSVKGRGPDRHRCSSAGHPETSEAQPSAAPGVRPDEPRRDGELPGQRGDRRELPVEFWRRVFKARGEHRAARLSSVSERDFPPTCLQSVYRPLVMV